MELITVKDLARQLKLSERSVRARIAAGAIPAVRVGVRAIRMNPEEVLRSFPKVRCEDTRKR